ncbi:MAG: pitrilysin family protein [Phycisphaeraceae bacterium]
MMPTFHHHTLANGLTVVAETNPAAHTAAVGFFVKTGARDEQHQVMGVSHFLEHMMFKGTDRRTADDVNREFDEIGANYNAFTSHEQTVYYAHVLPEFLPRAVDLIGDILRPALREDDFNMEKNVILEEIGMYDDQPAWRLQDELLEHYFRNHPLGFRVLGTRDTVSDLTPEQMRDYFQQRYAADNIVVSAVGRFEFDDLVRDIENVAGHWNRSGAVRRYDPPVVQDHQHTITDPKVTRHYIGLLCPAPSAQEDSRYAAKVLADVLGDADGSRLYWALVEPGLADEASFSYLPMDRVGCFMGSACCDPQRAEQVEQVLLKTIDSFLHDLTDEEVDRAKNKLATSATLQGESPRGRMSSIGSTWTYLGRYLPLEEELARVMAVTAEDLRQLVHESPMTPRTLLRLGPG